MFRTLRKTNRQISFPGREPLGTRGSILILVLWTVAVLGIITLNFAFQTRTHVIVTSHYAQSNQLRNIAFAGVEYAAATLRQDREAIDHLEETWAGSEEFERVEVGGGTFTLTREKDGVESAPAYGIEDEASKLNLRTATEEMLRRLEGIDQELADALLDWQDNDTDARNQGAESEYYEALASPYSCKDAPLTTLQELLLVKGFDETVLYGEDRNGNGVLDFNENDGDALPPRDNQDGILDRGILAYVTVYSSDRNVTLENKARVDIAKASASDLKKGISGLTQEEADAIAQYRGKTKFENLGDLLKVTEATKQSDGQKDRDGKNTGSKQDSQKNKNGEEKKNAEKNKNTEENKNTEKDEKKKSSGDRSSEGSSKSSGSGSGSSKKVFTKDRLKQIIDYCALGADKVTPGRINVNTAPKAVLQTLPGVTENLADAIVERRGKASGSFQNIAELLDVPGMTEDIFIPLSNLVTVRSFQFRVKSQARIEGINSQVTVTAVLDRTGERIQTLYWNED